MKANIFAFLPPRALGDFVNAAVIASSIREMFDEGQLFVYYRNDRPYKNDIIRLMPNITGEFTSEATTGMFPIDFLDPYGGRLAPKNDIFENFNVKDSKIVLAGGMLTETTAYSIPMTTLRIPPETVDSSDKALVDLGLDPKKWFAIVYWKESGYEFRWEDAKRIIYDPAPYIAAIRHIIEDLGGQVVRLGHPTPTELPEMKGLVDLAKVPNSQWLQIHATARARFFVGSSSGPASYAPAFGVPAAHTDQTLQLGIWNPDDYIVPQEILYQGKVHQPFEAYDAGFLFQEWKPTSEVKFIRNSVQQIVAVADEMYNVTRDCTGWRSLSPPAPRLPRPNALTLPFPRKYPDREFLIPPSQRQRRT
jgi:putative glycosyltransferase (TIGR04372 family)